MSISYIQPYAIDKNIGREYNHACSLVPDNQWICITDQDTMFLRPDTKKQIQDVVNENNDVYDLMGCMTNRLGLMHQCHKGQPDEDPNVFNHMKIADMLHVEHYRQVHGINHVIGGMLMLFPKSTWTRYPFKENSLSFDTDFCQRILVDKGRIGIMKGVYLFHLYRMGHTNPKGYNKHLAP